MKNAAKITIVADKREIRLNIRSILYVLMNGNIASIHCQKGKVYKMRITLAELEKSLDENFIKVKRGCIVSVFAIHDITDKINLCNGEKLDYAHRNRPEIENEFREKQRAIIHSFANSEKPKTAEEYLEHYKVFDDIPVAFTDIEMVFDDKFRAVDWVFRYGNSALAYVEKMPLEDLIGNTFGTVFPNMDPKWLRAYERVALFEETLTLIDHSPEIGTNLEIICFPTFKGHCGCILFDISKLNFLHESNDTQKAISTFIGKILG